MQRFAIAGVWFSQALIEWKGGLKSRPETAQKKRNGNFSFWAFPQDEVAYSVIMGDIETCQLQLV
jgi:hypothetical protein